MQCEIYSATGTGPHGSAPTVMRPGGDGQVVNCPSRGAPLQQWVKLNWNKFYRQGYAVRGQPLVVVCLECYKKIFGAFPMPSTYEGNEHGSLVTTDDERREKQQYSASYTVYQDDE